MRSKPQKRWHLLSNADLEIEIEIEFAAEEEMRTEISAKFTRERLEDVYEEAGLQLSGGFTDAASDYALSLARGSAR